MASMERTTVKLRVRDKDGKPFYFVAFRRRDAERLRDEIVGEARRLDCFMREIPILGHLYQPPYHRAFKVTHDGTLVTRIERR